MAVTAAAIFTVMTRVEQRLSGQVYWGYLSTCFPPCSRELRDGHPTAAYETGSRICPHNSICPAHSLHCGTGALRGV